MLPLFLCLSVAASADYRRQSENDPFVRAILWGTHTARALVQLHDEPFHVVPGTTLDRTWYVSEVRRRSVLFRNRKTGTFVEAPLVTREQPRFNRLTSFWSHEIPLWDAVEMAAMGYRYNVIMHYETGGSVKPQCHADSLERMLAKFMPSHVRFSIVGPILIVLPQRIYEENWREILARVKEVDPDAGAQRYSGLMQSGTLHSRGDDIQYVLRQISLGSGVPIYFPSTLHFPVFAAFKDMPFHHILSMIAIVNQCVLFDRSEGIEIQPLAQTKALFPNSQLPIMLMVGPWEPQPGSGPHPPAPLPWAPADPGAWQRLPPPAVPASETGEIKPADSF